MLSTTNFSVSQITFRLFTSTSILGLSMYQWKRHNFRVSQLVIDQFYNFFDSIVIFLILSKIVRNILLFIKNTMLANQCISVSELAKNASSIIKRSKMAWAQYVFVNNKPQAVILDIATFESLDIDPDILSPREIMHHAEARRDLEVWRHTSTLEELEVKYT